MPARREWTRDELLVAFRLYCRTPFGKLHQHNPEIIELARVLDRTPSSVGMKACNFASLDPVQRARGIRGLSGASAADRALWEEFGHNSETVANAAEEAHERLTRTPAPSAPAEFTIPDGPTEIMRTARARRVQRFFAAAVYTAYEGKCALTGLGVRELLNASHIIPWSEDEKRRAHPSNGILLNVLYDRAFDRHLITFDEIQRSAPHTCCADLWIARLYHRLHRRSTSPCSANKHDLSEKIRTWLPKMTSRSQSS